MNQNARKSDDIDASKFYTSLDSNLMNYSMNLEGI